MWDSLYIGDEKSNVIFLEKEEKTNIKIVLTVSKTVKVPGIFTNTVYTFYSPNLEKTNIDSHEFKRENETKTQARIEDENKKHRKKIITIVSIILSVVMLILCSTCVNNCNEAREKEDINKFSVTYDGYVITLETCVFVSYKVTNLSSKTREYACYYEIITQDDIVIAEGGNLVTVTIKPGETEIVAATCNPTSQGIKKVISILITKKCKD